jgi:cytoskeletal protein RodZ
MTGKKLILPAALLVGAVSMMGFQAFAQTPTPTTTPQAQVQATMQTVADQNKGADIETADDTDSATATDIETNDDGVQGAQSSAQDPNQADGETND